MLRTDFVSNSSSTTYIVSRDDNKYDICFSDYEIITFDEYVDRYIESDILFPYCDTYFNESSKNPLDKFQFVDSDKYRKAFARCVQYMFPQNCKKDLELYVALDKKYREHMIQSKDLNDDELMKLYHNMEDLKKSITDKIIKVLRPMWKDTIFHVASPDYNTFAELLDNDSENFEKTRNYGDCESPADLIGLRIDYINQLSHKSMKFYRGR